jgi:hypothetical protein
MSIYKGSNKVIALYKGATPIIKRYRGTYLIYEKGGDTPIEDEDIVLTYSQLDNNNEISFTINKTTYKGSTVNYSATKQELGINSITSVELSESTLKQYNLILTQIKQNDKDFDREYKLVYNSRYL